MKLAIFGKTLDKRRGDIVTPVSYDAFKSHEFQFILKFVR